MESSYKSTSLHYNSENHRLLIGHNTTEQNIFSLFAECCARQFSHFLILCASLRLCMRTVCVCVHRSTVWRVSFRELPGILFTSFVQFWSAPTTRADEQTRTDSFSPTRCSSLLMHSSLLLLKSNSHVPLTTLRLMHKRHRNFSLLAVIVQVCVRTRHRQRERVSYLRVFVCTAVRLKCCEKFIR